MRAGAEDITKPNDTERNVRTFLQNKDREWRTARGANFLIIIMSMLTLFMMIIPGLGVIFIAIMFYLSRKYTHPNLMLYEAPLRVPIHLGMPDGSRFLPGIAYKIENAKKYHGEGIYLYGTDRRNTGPREVWASKNDATTHALILGGTGSGKTELIYVLILNQLATDSGFIIVDAKGDISLQVRISEMLTRFYRKDDLLTITFASGDKDLSAASEKRATNTFNIMGSSSATMIIEIISNMVSNSDGGSDIWEGRCLAFVAALTRPLVFMRDRELIDLSPATFTEYMELNQIEDFLNRKRTREEKGIELTLEGLENFLITLPGYDRKKIGKGGQEGKTLEQFGYITMQLTRVFNDLAYNYGHIFNAKVGEIDVSDVVLNRRCLTVLLPALERSPATLNMLGRLIIGSIKQMMSGALGVDVEGNIRRTVESRSTSAPNAFRVILDEVGYIMVAGMSIIPAQARSLNIAMTFAAQSYSDLTRGNDKEAAAIWENTTIKFAGAFMGGSEQQNETFQRLQGFAGEIEQAVISGYQKEFSPILGNVKYRESDHVNIIKKNRLELSALKDQQNGQFLMFVSKKEQGGAKLIGGEIIPIQAMYAKMPNSMPTMSINDLVPISKAGFKVNDESVYTSLQKDLEDGSFFERVKGEITNVKAKEAFTSVLVNIIERIEATEQLSDIHFAAMSELAELTRESNTSQLKENSTNDSQDTEDVKGLFQDYAVSMEKDEQYDAESFESTRQSEIAHSIATYHTSSHIEPTKEERKIDKSRAIHELITPIDPEKSSFQYAQTEIGVQQVKVAENMNKVRISHVDLEQPVKHQEPEDKDFAKQKQLEATNLLQDDED